MIGATSFGYYTKTGGSVYGAAGLLPPELLGGPEGG